MADGRLEVFRRALLGRDFFAHVAPLRSRPGVASIIWESLVSIGGRSREHFTDNRSAHYLFIYIDIKKQLSRTVVRELLPRATTHRHQTFPDYGRHTRSQSKGGDVREEAPAEERAAKNLKTTVRHLGFTEKIYGFPRTSLCCQYKRRTPTVVRELLPRTSMKRAQTFPAVARCTSHQYKVVDVLT